MCAFARVGQWRAHTYTRTFVRTQNTQRHAQAHWRAKIQNTWGQRHAQTETQHPWRTHECTRAHVHVRVNAQAHTWVHA
eukprot:11505670-Alexandrium_andersonii.AAC.1